MVSQAQFNPGVMRMPGGPPGQPGQMQPGTVNLPPRYATPKTDVANVAGGTVVQVSQQGVQGQVMHLQVANAQPQPPQQNAGGQNVPPPNIMAPPLPPQQQQQQLPGNGNGEMLLKASFQNSKI